MCSVWYRSERVDSFPRFRVYGVLREQQRQPEHEQPHQQQLGAPRFAEISETYQQKVVQSFRKGEHTPSKAETAEDKYTIPPVSASVSRDGTDGIPLLCYV